ncbi:VWA domain-containing protein [Rhodococcus jostii]|uniref:VWA domain-containing protein n=1 Tax=Rhodococcus jostii TaxID=132919 RepID=UPI0009340A50|nr:VWA domain-containing protein [Rhodococcus jostii]
MSTRYRSGEVKRIIERMVPVAAQLDSDGNLEVYAHAGSSVAGPAGWSVDGTQAAVTRASSRITRTWTRRPGWRRACMALLPCGSAWAHIAGHRRSSYC